MYVLDNTIKTPYGNYLLKTASYPKEKQVISSLFNNGVVIHKNYFQYKNLEDDGLRKFVSDCHQSELNNLNFLIDMLSSHEDLSYDNLLIFIKALTKKGLYRDVLPILEELLDQEQSDPNKDQIFFYLGNIHDKLGNLDKAVYYYEKALKLKENYPDYQNAYGETLLKLEKTVDSIRRFQKAIRINVHYAEAHYNLGLAYIQNYINKVDYVLSKNFPDSSIREFETASELKPVYKTNNFSLGKEYLIKENWQKAYSCFLFAREEANFYSDDDEFILNFRLRILRENHLTIKEMRNYINRLEQRAQLHPNYPDLYNELGIAYIIFSKLLNNSAILQFKHATELNQNYQKAQKNLKLMEHDSIGYDIVLKVLTQ